MPKETCARKLFAIIFVAFGPLGLLAGVIVGPFAKLYDAWFFKWFQNRRISTPQKHRRKVARVQEQVKSWHSSGRKTLMCTARAAWKSFSFRLSNNRNLAKIHVDQLNSIVEINEAARTVIVEPGLMMGHVTSILIPRGWTIPVVPEFETLTVGGLICGTGVESNSGRYGLFADTALEYEVVLSNGDLVTCSPKENSDLFYSIPWSHGTLGFLMSVKLPLVSAKRYVALEYHATDSIEEAQRLLESENHEFVEGIAYGRRKFVVTLGNMVDRADPKRGSVNYINRWYKQFFYKHVESFLKKKRRPSTDPHLEFYPLRDYYHRHTRGFFWSLPLAVPYVNNPLFLFLFGWLMPGNAQLAKRVLVMSGIGNWMIEFATRNSVIQDFVIPMKHFKSSIDFVDDLVEVYPLWLCPCKYFKKPGMASCKDSETELYFDLGVYGMVATKKQEDYEFVTSNQKMEDFVIGVNGHEFLYGSPVLSRQDFRRMFDMSLYDQVRAKYQCVGAFPELYDKVCKHGRGGGVQV